MRACLGEHNMCSQTMSVVIEFFWTLEAIRTSWKHNIWHFIKLQRCCGEHVSEFFLGYTGFMITWIKSEYNSIVCSSFSCVSISTKVQSLSLSSFLAENRGENQKKELKDDVMSAEGYQPDLRSDSAPPTIAGEFSLIRTNHLAKWSCSVRGNLVWPTESTLPDVWYLWGLV